MWAWGSWTSHGPHMDLVASEQSEGRSDAESQPGRTRDVVGELVEAVPLCREGERSPGQDGCLAAERAE